MKNDWERAVEDAADILGAILMQSANGTADYSYDDIAAAALKAGLDVILRHNPSESRTGQCARVLYEQLHDREKHEWACLPSAERAFWSTVTRAILDASDRVLLDEIQG
jgi:hypothetical protein